MSLLAGSPISDAGFDDLAVVALALRANAQAVLFPIATEAET